MSSLARWVSRMGATSARFFRRDGRWWNSKAIAVVIPALAIGGVAFNGWLFTCGFGGCPTATEVQAFKPPEGGRILDRNGRLISRIVSTKRVNVPLSRVPAHVRRAFIATEDRRFTSHSGIDWRGAARALVRNVQHLGIREGFSTITMQAARTGFLTEQAARRRSFGRKLTELRIARILEQHLTKDQILELYLNAIYLGNGAYGVDAASRDLFGKRVHQLTVAEGAMLAALAKGPSTYSPRRHRNRARARRDLVLGLMRSQGYIDNRTLSRAIREPVRVNQDGWRPAQPHASWSTDAVRSMVDSIRKSLGVRSTELIVHTTLDLQAQVAGERAVRAHAARIERDVRAWNNGRGRERLQGAMVAVDPRSGDVRAIVGGRTWQPGGFNRALSARRQPGSAFKPFVYAAALSAGFTPASMVDDEPVSVELDTRIWQPANYGGEYRGPVTLRHALAQSANAATVRVSRSVGERRVVDAARRNGIDSDIPAVPAIALGAVEVTPLELVTAYAPFANTGFRVAPRLVRRIERTDGVVLWSSEISRVQVMDERDAFQLTSMLRSVVDEGTGRAVRARGITGPVAGKTGTTNGGSDVWFVGYTPSIVAGFWFGFDAPQSMGGGANGGRYAAPAWADFYASGWTETANRGAWSAPGGLVAVEIDSETGLLADEWCPNRRSEWFKEGTEPTERCDGHHGHAPDLIGSIIARFEDQDFKPLTRALRRLLRDQP
ncbi:MAG: penicillin-binding protein 1A [Gemmatimonadota bacterium]